MFSETEKEEITAPVDPKEEDKGGMSKAGVAFLILFVLLCIIPLLLILAAFLTAKYYPKSPVG